MKILEALHKAKEQTRQGWRFTYVVDNAEYPDSEHLGYTPIDRYDLQESWRVTTQDFGRWAKFMVLRTNKGRIAVFRLHMSVM